MDNATFHKTQTTKHLIEQAQCDLLFLPPYSPDLNPIEKVWANIKQIIRSIAHKFNSLKDVVDYAFQRIN